MPGIDREAALFSLRAFAAAMLALYLGFALGLPRPYWAMSTAYIVSQPLAGAVRSRAIFRLMGTILGGAAAVVMVPALANAPVLLSLAMALWVGGCLAVSLLDRSPRSYVMMLAGYTAAIIGFPGAGVPAAIFDVAIARVTEIGLGIGCATLLHTLVFPRPVDEALRRRARAWLAEADRWLLDILRGGAGGALASDRRHLAAAAGEIQMLSAHLPFDTSAIREKTAEARALHGRLLLLLPLLSGVADRLATIGPIADAAIRAILDDVPAWVAGGVTLRGAEDLEARIAEVIARRQAADLDGLMIESLLTRLGEVLLALADAHALADALGRPAAPEAPRLLSLMTAAGYRRRLHVDVPIALLSGASAAVAILLVCALWIGAGWGDGANAAMMTAVFCCFFASLDDPSPAILHFGLCTLAILPLAALYQMAVLPAIDGYVMLAAVLAPPLLILGLFMPDPRTFGSVLPAIMGFCNALALQETFTADFAAFLNSNLGQFVGLLCALFVTATLRSMGAEAGVRRLVSRTWRSLAELARARTAPPQGEFLARTVDRLGLLTPKLAAAPDGRGDAIALEALRDLRLGMNIVEIQALRPSLPAPARGAVDAVLASVGDHFAARARGRPGLGREAILRRIDGALAALKGPRTPDISRGLTGLMGLRLNLFPTDPPRGGVR